VAGGLPGVAVAQSGPGGAGGVTPGGGSSGFTPTRVIVGNAAGALDDTTDGSYPPGSYTMAQLSHLLEQLDPRTQVFFFKRLKETSPDSLKDFAPLYYGFMNEFHSLLFT